jgi:uncharacterized protein (TIGR04141 family)
VEPCDLFGPAGELIHVKPAGNGSSPLSHLFYQGMVSAELLHFDAEARAAFIKKVKKVDGREVSPDWRPRHVVFAVASTNRRTRPEAFFTFAKVALVRRVQRLEETLGMRVSVIPVHRVPES